MQNNAKMAEIPIWVYDRPKWVSGITPNTSCDDILRSLTLAPGSLIRPEDLKYLILTEKWRDVEKPLAKDSKLLKIWSAWGDEQKFVKFIVKRISSKSAHHRKSGRLRRRGSISSVASVDEMHPKALAVIQRKSSSHQTPPSQNSGKARVGNTDKESTTKVTTPKGKQTAEM